MNGLPENLDPGRQQIVDLDFLRGLISAVDESGIDSLEISRGGTRIRIAKTPPAAPVAPAAVAPAAATVTRDVAPAATVSSAPAPAEPAGPAPTAAPSPAPAVQNNWVEVKSPMVGTFYRAPSPEAPNYVEMGAHVTKGQTLCILEAMKLMNELESEFSGTVREICVENSEPVEYGQVLFRIEPEA
ncbi:MAG TPA: acetyl-CoA carboxylase biotin carboxyl carrier protein [Longimicrobiaceae bacterium]|nr:acetyl-CoA carboxylase biotin carboxyl carrier protein [Longimicrobiaceae bacterium]